MSAMPPYTAAPTSRYSDVGATTADSISAAAILLSVVRDLMCVKTFACKSVIYGKVL